VQRFAMLRILALSLFLAPKAFGCETALLLSIDISGSIDAGEYAIQTEGLSLALNDAAIADTLVAGQIALAVVHWSGVGRQALVLPWKRMLSLADVRRFADAVAVQPRAFTASDTAVGQAIDFSAAQFTAVVDCKRKVIDISGDGPENSGYTDAQARARTQAMGIEINAIAIEDMGSSAPVTQYYQKWVITKGGFVMTARGLADYPRAIREKILREISKVIG
jgi:Ca-activated chloride channel homolog